MKPTMLIEKYNDELYKRYKSFCVIQKLEHQLSNYITSECVSKYKDDIIYENEHEYEFGSAKTDMYSDEGNFHRPEAYISLYFYRTDNLTSTQKRRIAGFKENMKNKGFINQSSQSSLCIFRRFGINVEDALLGTYLLEL